MIRCATSLAGSLRIPLGIVRQIRDLLADPGQIPDATSAAADTFRGIVNQLGDTEKARSPLWTERSLRRHLEVASAPFTETRASARKLGGTLNTAFMTVATEAASRYHAELGAPVESLRASMAISTRTDESGANAFSLVRMLVPTGRHPDRRAVQGDPRVESGGGRPVEEREPRDHRRLRVDVADLDRHPDSPASRHRRSTSRPRT